MRVQVFGSEQKNMMLMIQDGRYYMFSNAQLAGMFIWPMGHWALVSRIPLSPELKEDRVLEFLTASDVEKHYEW